MKKLRPWLGLASVAALLLAGIYPLAAKQDTKNQLKTVTIVGKAKEQPTIAKPLFDIPFDSYESIRSSFEPDQTLLLAQSPAIIAAGAEAPAPSKNGHMLEPWTDILFERIETFSLPVKSKLEQAQGGPLRAKDAQGMSWSLNIVDEGGRPFQHFEGKGSPPDQLPWNGRTEAQKWLAAGHDYSAVYVFTLVDGTPRTVLGPPLRFAALMHKDAKGTVISLDSSQLFGAQRDQSEVSAPEGQDLLRAAADLLRRNAYGSGIEVRLYGGDKELGGGQAKAAADYLVSELSLAPGKIKASFGAASPDEARLDLVVKAAR
jgi:hypothetical protein